MPRPLLLNVTVVNEFLLQDSQAIQQTKKIRFIATAAYKCNCDDTFVQIKFELKYGISKK